MSELEEAVGSTPMNPSYRKIPDMVAQDPPFKGGQVKPRRTDAEIAKAVSALAKKARLVQKQKNKKDKM
jgi:hypothetical protein